MNPACATSRGDMAPASVRPIRRHAPCALALCVLAVLVAWPISATAEGPPVGCEGVDPAALVARVQARYDGIRDLDASFSQSTRSVLLGGAGLGDEAPTTGQVQIAKPGRMRWSYESPRRSLVVSDGQTLWIHDVDAREVTRARVTSGYLAGAALQFLMGEGAIVDAFDVTLVGCDGNLRTLELTPKQDASYEMLELVVDVEGVVVGTTIHDLFGNVTALRFSNVRFDLAPGDEIFRWQPEEGVRVIDLVPQP